MRNGRQKSKMAATKFSFLSFQHQTAVISRASSRSPCLLFFSFWGNAMTLICYHTVMTNWISMFLVSIKTGLMYVDSTKSQNWFTLNLFVCNWTLKSVKNSRIPCTWIFNVIFMIILICGVWHQIRLGVHLKRVWL